MKPSCNADCFISFRGDAWGIGSSLLDLMLISVDLFDSIGSAYFRSGLLGAESSISFLICSQFCDIFLVSRLASFLGRILVFQSLITADSFKVLFEARSWLIPFLLILLVFPLNFSRKEWLVFLLASSMQYIYYYSSHTIENAKWDWIDKQQRFAQWWIKQRWSYLFLRDQKPKSITDASVTQRILIHIKKDCYRVCNLLI